MNKAPRIMSVAVASALTAWSVAAVAGGFGIATQSGSGTGNAFAGGAAVADDASVVWSNPAGMTALPTGFQVTGALHALRPSFKFNNTASTGAFAAGGNGGDGGDWSFIPNAFFAMSVNPNLRLGLAINAPFGLKTEYDPGWQGQFLALKSEIKTVNIQPSVAYKVNNLLSIGAGVNLQRIEAELTNFAGPAAGTAKLGASDWGWGYNLGATLQPAAGTRIGLHYRSAIKYTLQGSATFAGGAASGLLGGNVQADLKTPDSASLSFVQALGSNVELMGDVTWTHWSNVQNLTVIRTTANAVGNPAGSVLTSLPFLWDDTWRFGLGANYRVSTSTKLRFGVAYDPTPTKDATRTPRLPGQDRTWLALGVQWKPSKQGTLEFAYAHEFVKDANINAGTTGVPGALVGKFKNKADIISLQYSHAF